MLQSKFVHDIALCRESSFRLRFGSPLITHNISRGFFGPIEITAGTRRNTVTVEQSVEHVQYLYEANFEESLQDMFLINSHGDKVPVDTLYMDIAVDAPNSLSGLFGAGQSIIKFYTRPTLSSAKVYATMDRRST